MADFEVDFNFNDVPQKPRAGGATPPRPDMGGVGVGVTAQDQNFTNLMKQGFEYQGVPELLNILSILSDASSIIRKTFLTARKVFQIFTNTRDDSPGSGQRSNRNLRFEKSDGTKPPKPLKEPPVQKEFLEKQKRAREAEQRKTFVGRLLLGIRDNFLKLSLAAGTASTSMRYFNEAVRMTVRAWQVLNRSIDSFIGKVSAVSPQILTAQAQADIAKTMTAIRANQRGGSAAANIIESRTGVANAITELMAEVTRLSEPIITLVNGISENLINLTTVVLKSIGPFIDLVASGVNSLVEFIADTLDFFSFKREIDLELVADRFGKATADGIRAMMEKAEEDDDALDKDATLAGAIDILSGGALGIRARDRRMVPRPRRRALRATGN
jgi:hypothetical protein